MFGGHEDRCGDHRVNVGLESRDHSSLETDIPGARFTKYLTIYHKIILSLS